MQLSTGPAVKVVARPHGRRCLRVSCSQETQHLFNARLQEKGWKAPRILQTLHPIAQEGWRSIHQIYSAALETPLVPAPWLAELAEGSSVHFKAEDRQAGSTAKTRGAAHKLLSLSDEQLAHGVVAASTGNHALAMLLAAAAVQRQRGVRVPVRLFLPRNAAPGKLGKLQEQQGAQVELVGEDSREAEAAAREAAAEAGATFVSSYNDEAIAGGQGSIAVELLMQLPRGRLDAVFVPVGGGSLAAGISAVLKSVEPSIHVVGCQPAAADAMRQSVAAGRVVEAEVPGGATLATGSLPPGGALEAGAVTLDPLRRFVDEWVVVGEEEIARAVVGTVTHSGMQVEGDTGVAVAAFQKIAPQMRGKHCVIIATGGNMTAEGMARVYALAGERRRTPSAV